MPGRVSKLQVELLVAAQAVRTIPARGQFAIFPSGSGSSGQAAGSVPATINEQPGRIVLGGVSLTTTTGAGGTGGRGIPVTVRFRGTPSRSIPSTVRLSGTLPLTGRLGGNFSRPGLIQPGNPATGYSHAPTYVRTIPSSAFFRQNRRLIPVALAASGGLTSALGLPNSRLLTLERVGLFTSGKVRVVPIQARFSSISVLRVTQAALEAITAASPNLVTTQAALEALTAGSPNLRTTQTAVEVLTAASPNLVTTQVAIEVLTPNRQNWIPAATRFRITATRAIPVAAILTQLRTNTIPSRVLLWGNTSSLGIQPSRFGYGLILGGQVISQALTRLRFIPATANLQYTSTHGRVTQAGVETVVQGANARITQAGIAVVVQGNNARITQAPLEVLIKAGNIRLTQAVRVVLAKAGNIRLTQASVIALVRAGNIRLTQAVLVVLVPPRERLIPASGQFRVTRTRSIPATVRLGRFRSVPVSVRLRSRLSRSIPATGRFGPGVTTHTRTIPASAQFALNHSRTVPLHLPAKAFGLTRTVPITASFSIGELKIPATGRFGKYGLTRRVALHLTTARARPLPRVIPVSVSLFRVTVPGTRTVPLHMPTGTLPRNRGILSTGRFSTHGVRTVPLSRGPARGAGANGGIYIPAVGRLLRPGTNPINQHTVPLKLVAADARVGIHITEMVLEVLTTHQIGAPTSPLIPSDVEVAVSQFVIEVIIPHRPGGPYGQMVG
jgi:hypothetical protein